MLHKIFSKFTKCFTKYICCLSGHPNFPYCFGLRGSDIVMEYFGTFCENDVQTSPNFSKLCRTSMFKLTIPRFVFICKSILTAVMYMHSKKVLHNDIKADNVVVCGNRVVVIDFGKVSCIKQPVVYNIHPGSDEQMTYNKYHRHLAYELRNIPNTRQSVETDTYSVGYLFKYSGVSIPYQPIIEIGSLLNSRSLNSRISLQNAINRIDSLK